MDEIKYFRITKDQVDQDLMRDIVNQFKDEKADESEDVMENPKWPRKNKYENYDVKEFSEVVLHGQDISSVEHFPLTNYTKIHTQDTDYFVRDSEQQIYIKLMEFEGKFGRFPSIKLNGRIHAHIWYESEVNVKCSIITDHSGDAQRHVGDGKQ